MRIVQYLPLFLFRQGFSAEVDPIVTRREDRDKACRELVRMKGKNKNSLVETSVIRCNERDQCADLLWTDNKRTSVEIDQNVGKRLGVYYPVTCSEAVYEVKRSAPTVSKDIRTHSSNEPKKPKYPHEARVSFLDETCGRLGDLISKSPQRGSSRCVQKQCTGLTWTDSTRTSIKQGNGIEVSCYEAVGFLASRRAIQTPRPTGKIVKLVYHKNPKEKRVRVLATFLKQGTTTPLSLMFDTGSDKSLLRIKGNHEGYSDKLGIAQEYFHNIIYGTQAGMEITRIVKKVDESISLAGAFPGFTFDISMGLAEETAADIDEGLLGAARGTPFSRAAGTFAYLPSRSTAGNAGSLLIGSQHDWKSFCRNAHEPVFIKTKDSQFLWIVGGAASIGQKQVAVNWAVDTGAVSMYVPPMLYDEIVRAIETTGSKVDGGFVTECSKNRSAFPTVNFIIGHDGNQVTLPLTPNEYATEYSGETSLCEFHLHQADLGFIKDTFLLGEPLLRKMLTIFSEEKSEMGFCLL